ncbi:right-handed parallel beta-helix repeat-containing protein [Bacillus horti]|uniref:Right-handed parallel beta-helix repeat-containing protein n=1 Tax=Caldalkalibacillus horti TaxID=77523 RepID=A0ABT9W174_9BACI|nr:right-handed parallel beta-helix repeat-containing protein [Bacillus horti]MDQ0167016.1 hypothetical protein [Bacillus horti]
MKAVTKTLVFLLTFMLAFHPGLVSDAVRGAALEANTTLNLVDLPIGEGMTKDQFDKRLPKEVEEEEAEEEIGEEEKGEQDTVAEQEEQGYAADLEWQSITFGQSTDLNFASNVLPEKVGTNYADPEVPGTIEGTIVLESRGGKLASGHDGLTFYYTKVDAYEYNFVLEADMIIEQFGPETGVAPNSQDSAGIMVRDANGGARQDPMIPGFEEVPAASNIFGVGMMRHGISPIYRTGVEYPWGNLGSRLTASRFDQGIGLVTDTPIRVKLERTDTHFIMSATFVDPNHPDAGEVTVEKSIEGADLVQVIDSDYMYVGFYAARNAKMLIQNASISLSPANTLPSPPEEPPAPPEASLALLSAPQSGSEEYTLKTIVNYGGVIRIVQDGQTVLRHGLIEANQVFEFDTALANDENQFRIFYSPRGAPSNSTVVTNLTVTKKIFNSGAGLFAAPNGSSEGDGTVDSPLDLETAIRYVLPGETVFMRGGTYTPSSMITIRKEYSGEEGKRKTLAPYNGERVIIDGQESLNNVLQLQADYWHLYGFEITRAQTTGMRLSGDHNIVEMMTFNYNGDTGFHISGGGFDPELWPKYNLVLNCESHDNRDPSDINADGFAAKLGVGVGNVFRGNIAHHNIDDGWDLYNRTNEGANMPILLEGNISYSNGKLSNGYNQHGDTGNGFKLGGEGLPVNHVVRNNIAFDNNMDGFSDNFNPGALEIENNTSFNNKRFNFIFRINPYFTPEQQGIFRNNLSFHTNPEGKLADFVSGDVDATNFFFDGEKTVNSSGVVVHASDFVHLNAPPFYERGENGEIIWGDFLRLIPKSLLNARGINGGHVGALPANPIAPQP